MTRAQLDAQIVELRTRQDTMDRELRKRQDDLLESTTRLVPAAMGIFGTLAVVITLVSFIQLRSDSRVLKLLKEQLDDSQRTAELYRANITEVNGILATVKGAYTFNDDLDKAREKLDQLEAQVGVGVQHFEGQVRALNEEALRLSAKARRDSVDDKGFGRDVRSFAGRYENVVGLVDVDGRLNANCYYILAFDSRIQGDYSEADQHFTKAIKLAEDHLSAPDKELLYNPLPEGKTATEFLRKLANICHYHLATLLYNRGRYSDAIDHFSQAVQFDRRDIKSRMYVPEAQFLSRRGDFDEISRGFEIIIADIAALGGPRSADLADSHASLQAQAYLKLGNCYLGSSGYKPYDDRRDLIEAEKCYRRACELDPQSAVSHFSLAQTLAQRQLASSASDDRELKREFRIAFGLIKERIGATAEVKTLMMCYYMLAIAVAWGQIEGEVAHFYLMRVQELQLDLPEVSDLTIFSPKTKCDRTLDEFMDEVRSFEVELARQVEPALRATSYRGRR